MLTVYLGITEEIQPFNLYALLLVIIKVMKAPDGNLMILVNVEVA